LCELKSGEESFQKANARIKEAWLANAIGHKLSLAECEDLLQACRLLELLAEDGS